MRNRLLTGLLMILMIGTAAGCGKNTEDLTQPITVEFIEQSGQQGEEADFSRKETDLKETENSAGEETRKEVSDSPDRKEKAESEIKEEDISQADPEKEAYYAVLKELYKTYTLPDGTELGYDGMTELSYNKFAICDIDRDGKRELIILWTTTYTAGMTGIVYGYDSASDSVKPELYEFPSQTFYENGVVRVELSHNHGMAGEIEDFWPYTLYRYDQNSDTYLVAAEVDAWNKEYYETDYQNMPFPDELDYDGDGILYRITVEGSEKLIDLEEYNKWQDTMIGTSQIVEIPFVEITEESIEG